MKQICLTQNKTTRIDDEDFNRVNQFRWRVYQGHGGNWRAIRSSSRDVNGKQKTIAMPRYIMDVSDKNICVDHINHNTLDNRRSNLRLCTNAENCYNRKIAKRNTSGYKGVSYIKDSKKWLARIKVNGKSIHIGHFNNPKNAHEAYCSAALKYFGEFAYFGKETKQCLIS